MGEVVVTVEVIDRMLVLCHDALLLFEGLRYFISSGAKLAVVLLQLDDLVLELVNGLLCLLQLLVVVVIVVNVINNVFCVVDFDTGLVSGRLGVF